MIILLYMLFTLVHTMPLGVWVFMLMELAAEFLLLTFIKMLPPRGVTYPAGKMDKDWLSSHHREEGKQFQV